MRLFSHAVVRSFAPDDDPSATPPDAILVDGETIVAVGTRDDLLDIAAAQTSSTAALASAGGVGATAVIPGAAVEEIDCGGRVILPGLIDAHMHSVAYADSLTNLDLSGSRSLAEAVAAIRERAQTRRWAAGSSAPAGTSTAGTTRATPTGVARPRGPRPPGRDVVDRPAHGVGERQCARNRRHRRRHP